MDIKQYLDSTYLKTASQANLSKKENNEVVTYFIQEAIDNDFKLIMIRPDKVALAKKNDSRIKFKSDYWYGYRFSSRKWNFRR